MSASYKRFREDTFLRVNVDTRQTREGGRRGEKADAANGNTWSIWMKRIELFMYYSFSLSAV